MRLIDTDELGVGEANRDVFIVPEYADGWNSAIKMIKNAPVFSSKPCEADAIEQLLAENAKLKAERDAAVEDIKKNWLCASCEKRVIGKEWCKCKSVSFAELADGSVTCENYEWRGVTDIKLKAKNGSGYPRSGRKAYGEK